VKILITGVSGLLGINLALELTQAHQVFGIVNDHLAVDLAGKALISPGPAIPLEICYQ
jgi:nucleoside-diphosphate-sugar epimerase